ncbi:entry exclusion protein TrbK [uncultured Nitratireductor sp.]|uniref:entry exclusion protein TrbK n=1 Tax=uncultured Nitratireductor sp. TaxID=520953 RepID=UPI0025F5ADE4|nr:entry exclusion protein TrbK [uncultured Nitratireductor sp.]
MTRTLIIAAATVIVGIAVAVWVVPNLGGAPDRARRPLDTPPEYDTTGGQEMRPRWNNGKGQGNEATGN